MYFIQYELRPAPESSHFATAGGAIANCFVDADSAAKAQEIAAENFADNGWLVVSIEEGPREVERADYLGDPEWLEWFDEASTDGECYVFRHWPPGPQEDDEVH